jgi:Fe-S cluster biogenesis protein NfuA
MGIRNIVNSQRDRYDPALEPPLAITEAAAEEIRSRLAGYEGGEDLAFFVLTQPTALGFSVGVGFEPKSSDRPLRPEYAVPFQVTDEDYTRLRGYTIDVRAGKFVTFTNVSVHVAETPNPESRKFSLNRNLMTEGSATYARPAGEDDPPLVRFLLGIPEVKSLFFIQSFCTVTRMPESDWADLQAEVGKRLQAYFAHGGTAMAPPERDLAELAEVERRIVEVLEEVVRPAVQRDGGDIAFAGYDEGVVQLYMLGSCTGCPSARATLKMGVETLLKDAIPEVREVVAID